MTRFGLDLLKELLSVAASREAAAALALKALLPFMRKLAAGKFILPAAAEVDAKKLAKAIQLATGREVLGVLFVSAAEPFRRPAWMSERTHGDLVSRALKGSVGGTLESRLRERFEQDLLRDFGLDKGFARKLAVKVQTVLSDALIDSFESGIYWATGRELPFGLAGNLRAAVFYLVALAAAGDAKRAAELAPLVRLLPDVVPIGDLRHDPAVWLVLAA